MKYWQLLIILLLNVSFSSALERQQNFIDVNFLLSLRDYQSVNRKFEAFQQKTGLKFYGLLVTKIENQSIDDFSQNIMKEWDADLLLVVCEHCKDVRLLPSERYKALITESTNSKILN